LAVRDPASSFEDEEQAVAAIARLPTIDRAMVRTILERRFTSMAADYLFI
jgi:hypothetical protein